MSGDRASQPCALCSVNPSTRLGEHVIPTWLIDDLFPPADGPYTTDVNGEPVRTREGRPRGHNYLPRLILPVCNPNGHGCNAQLNTRFETTDAKAGVRGMHAAATLTPAKAEAAGQWWLKTLLLSKHPDAAVPGDGPPRPVWDRPIEDQLYTWMVDGTDPPAHVSVWMSRRGPHVESGDSADVERINLPHFEFGGKVHRSRASVLGIGDLYGTVVVHPGWQLTHPLEASGHAVRIWPWPGGPLDMAALVPCGPVEFNTLMHTFGTRVTLHLAPGFDPIATPLSLGPCWDSEIWTDHTKVIGASWG